MITKEDLKRARTELIGHTTVLLASWLQAMETLHSLVGFSDPSAQRLAAWGVKRWPQAAAAGYARSIGG